MFTGWLVAPVTGVSALGAVRGSGVGSLRLIFGMVVNPSDTTVRR
jgi:hypothetical protein